MKVGGSLLTAASFVGFVALTGGALIWARFSAAQLPADQALAAFPRRELLVTGAGALTIFVVLGLVALAAVYSLDNLGRPTDGMRRGLMVLTTAEVLVAIALVSDQECERIAAAVVMVLVGAAGLFTAYFPAEENWLTRRRKKHLDWVTALTKEVPVTAAPERKARQLRARGILVQSVVMLVVAVFLWGLLELWVGAALLVATFLGTLCLGISRATGARFWAYGTAVFFSVLLFGGVLSVMRTYASPEVQPAALVRRGDLPAEGLQGLYITQNDERVYLGSVTRKCGSNKAKKDSGEIWWVPNDQTVALSIGALQSIKKAGPRARQLLKDLIRVRVAEVPEPTGAEGSGKGQSSTIGGGQAEQDKPDKTDIGDEAEVTPRPHDTKPAVIDRCKD